jgi:iron-sulfur cluster insertion protein
MDDIRVSDAAFVRLESILKNDKEMLRISVEGGGCSGFKYKYDIVSNSEVGDIFIIKNKVKIVIDEISSGFLKNCTLDFIEELGSSYFSIINPAAKAKCGCGSSFNV